MTVQTVKEISSGRGSETVSTRGTTETRHTRMFRVITDDPFDADLDILWADEIPQIGDPHPSDGIAFARASVPMQDGQTKLIWTVRVTYSTAFPVSSNPIDDPPAANWATQTYQRPLIRDRATGILVTNAAGDVFVPPFMIDDSRMSVSVRANLSAVPVALLSFRDAVNSAPFTIDGVSVATGYAKISSVSVGEVQNRNSVSYRVFSYSMQIKDSDEVVGWQPVIPNLGLKFIAQEGTAETNTVFNQKLKFLAGDGSNETVPQMLALNGDRVGDALQPDGRSRDPADATFLTFTGYASLNFNALPGVGV